MINYKERVKEYDEVLESTRDIGRTRTYELYDKAKQTFIQTSIEHIEIKQIELVVDINNLKYISKDVRSLPLETFIMKREEDLNKLKSDLEYLESVK